MEQERARKKGGWRKTNHTVSPWKFQ